MDEVKIGNGFTSSVISKIIKGKIRKKLGCDVEIQINEINATITDEKAHIHFNADAELDKSELKKILKVFNLGV